jgi:hypothetical protein
MESYATRSNGKYTGATIATLRADEGLRIPAGVTMSLPQGYQWDRSYCFEAIHAGLPASMWHYAQATGAPQPGPCLIPPDWSACRSLPEALILEGRPARAVLNRRPTYSALTPATEVRAARGRWMVRTNIDEDACEIKTDSRS